MALYLIGDAQGCDAALGRLFDTLGFSASRDTAFLLGDLVNRGPASLAVLRRVHALGAAAQCVLGNHDLHLLAVANGVRPPGRKDTIAEVLDAPDCSALLDWLRHQPMALHRSIGGENLLMVHAGVLPQWTTAQTLALSAEVESVLRSNSLAAFLREMYGDTADRWRDDLAGGERLRVIVNALTRLRYCSAEGVMDFDAKGAKTNVQTGLMPWFDVPGRRTADITIAFGHWSTLGWMADRRDVLSLDTGCVWGGCLSAVRLGGTLRDVELIQVDCEQEMAPGG